MNTEEMNKRLDELTAQADEMSQKLSEARDRRSDLLRQRFDLKERRRYFRAQLRESADNPDRIAEINTHLEALETQLEELDGELDQVETVIDTTSGEMEDVMDQVEDFREDAPEAPEAPETPESAEGEPVSGEDVVSQTMEKLNGLLQRGLQKVADTLENIDFEKVGENVSSAASRAYKTVGGVAEGAARSIEDVWTDAKESREAPGGIGDYHSSGSSTIDGGCYNRILVSGACKVSSDLVCRELRASGSFRACGGVDCNGAVRTTGTATVAGDLVAGSLGNAGSLKVQGSLTSGPFTSTGGTHVSGDLKATALRSSGSLHVDGDVEADSFTTTGGLNIGGMVNADKVSIQVAVGGSQVGSIGGSDVKVLRSATGGLLSSLGVPAGTLTADSIEGDSVDIASVKAHVVRGANVVIRGGCDIDQVEYTDACTVDGDARVGSCVKI